MRRLSLVLLCFSFVVIGGAAASSRSDAAKTAITPAPAFTAEQMNAPAGNNWLSNMGNLPGDRYSSLTQVTPANVSSLKEAWHINLGTCPTKDAACGSLEANAVVYDGTYYIQTPKSDVFALDAATGATLWHWVPSYDPAFNVGTGGRQPGVAIADGKVFAPTRDGFLVAIDQMLGATVWKTEVLPWKKGGRVSDAPIYYNGMILTGDSGGDGGSASNGMHAYDATTGRELWTWGIVPAHGQPGGDTWSGADSNYGGGAMWESPVIDTKLNLAIFGTGNPVPWNSRGPGKNLYTDSIVALNVYTGALVWYYQTAHHDLWDSDLPNNGVEFTGKYNWPTKVKVKVAHYVRIHGKRVKRFKTVTKTKLVKTNRTATAFVNKYGMTFVLDAETGKPLIPIKEVKVPQSSAPDVNTWPTQPVPQSDNVLFNKLNSSGIPCTDGTVSQTNAYTPYSSATAPDGKPFKIGCAYDPYDTTQYVVTPFEMMDWPASSYDPLNHSMITCGVTGRATGFEQIPAASQVPTLFGGLGAARLGVSDGSTPISNTGNFTSLNVQTGRYTYHQHWPAICYSGSATTAGGVTFVGHFGTGDGSKGDGYLEAVDSKTGKSLWTSPTMPYPVAAAPIVYSVNGKEYVTVEVGGAGHNDVTRPAGLLSPVRVRGDYVYTFALG
jgi:quinohemoprotein ethanol dehydrogenase